MNLKKLAPPTGLSEGVESGDELLNILGGKPYMQ